MSDIGSEDSVNSKGKGKRPIDDLESAVLGEAYDEAAPLRKSREMRGSDRERAVGEALPSDESDQPKIRLKNPVGQPEVDLIGAYFAMLDEVHSSGAETTKAEAEVEAKNRELLEKVKAGDKLSDEQMDLLGKIAEFAMMSGIPGNIARDTDESLAQAESDLGVLRAGTNPRLRTPEGQKYLADTEKAILAAKADKIERLANISKVTGVLDIGHELLDPLRASLDAISSLFPDAPLIQFFLKLCSGGLGLGGDVSKFTKQLGNLYSKACALEDANGKPLTMDTCYSRVTENNIPKVVSPTPTVRDDAAIRALHEASRIASPAEGGGGISDPGAGIGR